MNFPEFQKFEKWQEVTTVTVESGVGGWDLVSWLQLTNIRSPKVSGVGWLRSLGQSTSISNYNLFYLTTLGMIGGWDLACWLYSQTSCGWVEPNLSLVKVCLNYKFSRVDWQSILLVEFGTLVENGVTTTMIFRPEQDPPIIIKEWKLHHINKLELKEL